MINSNSHPEYSRAVQRPMFQRRTSQRRQGQALLLAVLVMVFVSLIGATFITVVATNIGQTARSEEKDKAHQAAAAGLAFANLQLTESEWGTQWRANDSSKGGVLPGASNDNFYWSPFDQAQGWNTAGFTKFPDPRSTNPNFNAPNYMVKVEKVLQGETDNSNNDKTGALRITTIGLSSDESSTFFKSVAYKGGLAQSPLTNSSHSVTNWDFVNSVVPSAVTASASSGTSMALTSVQGNFPLEKFYVILGDPISNNVRGAAVSSRSGNTLVFASSQTWANGERVELAAGIGAPKDLDYDNDSSTAKTVIDFKVSQSSQPGSIWVNGGLYLMGNIFANNLRSDQVSAPGFPAGKVHASGLMARDVGTENLTIGGTSNYQASGTNGTLNSAATLALASNVASFPAPASSGATAWKDTSGTILSAYEKDQLITDGWNRIAGNVNPERQAEPFTPPDITAGGNGFGRYRELTKHSQSLDVSNPQGSAYGWGEGIYINNPQDKERIGTGSGIYRDMTSAEMRNMWSVTTTGSEYYRRGTPATSNINTKSLEEQHLRGWVGPDEFRARGVLIELIDDNPNTAATNDPAVTITLDPRADNITGDLTRSNGPVASKGWSTTSGSLMGGALGGVYQQTLPWPANGVIMAEGNIRIRGSLSNVPPRSLSVVSMNNIYIEGSLSAGGTRKVMLLAKKNVILNPTRILGRPDAQSRLSAATVANSTSVSVYDASNFQIGDWIKIDTNSSNDPDACVIGVNSSTNVLTLSQAVTAQPANTIVRTIQDPVNSGAVPYNRYANRLERFSQALQRRVFLPAGSNQVRLAMRHSGERRDALTITTEASNGPSPVLVSARLTNKLAPSVTTGIIKTTDKFLKIAFAESGTGSTSGTDLFPSAAPATEAAAKTYFVAEENPPRADQDSSSDTDDLLEDMQKRRSNPFWNYYKANNGVKVINGFGTNTGATLIPPPFFFLASVGNRYDWGTQAVPYTPTPWSPWSKDVLDGSSYTIPMATSVILTLDGANSSTLRNDTPDATLGTASGYEEVKQFGFSFYHGDAAATPADTWEDVLTSAQSFYNNGYFGTAGAGDNTYYTYDSRVISGASGGSNSIAFKLNPLAKNYFDDGTTHSMPYYRLSRLKLENINQLNGANEFENLDAGYTINVNAYVYAQEGSWYVIPGDYFDASANSSATDSDVRRTHVNLPGGGAGQDAATGKIENLDLNRDGVISRAEQVATYRFHRYNYQINFTGAIMENTSPIVRNVGSIATEGTVEDWMNKWATAKISSANFSAGNFDNTTMNYGDELGNINYAFDSDAANPGSALASDPGFHPPISPELLYQTG